MILDKPYSKEQFDVFLKAFLPDYQKDERPVRTSDSSILTQVTQLGASRKIGITVLEAACEETDSKKRIAITQAAFKVLRDHGIRNAIVAFHNGVNQWRLSLLTSTLEIRDGKVVKKDSNPRRYSYLLGVGAKTVTPYKYLVEKGRVEDMKQLQERFSVEVVNKQFYASVAELFTKLVGGERGSTKYPGLLKINSVISQNVEHQEFAVRLIGRIIFSWFLKEKKSAAGVPIVPGELLSLDAVASNADYYHSILEPLFFELLNKRVEHRHESLREVPFSTVPYLNGGLFSPQRGDFYSQNSFNGAGTPGLTHIPDGWFTELFTILEQYNFTVDENTSYDVDLSIDPEMLGRIFENLLAEINPETGESARKSTGSFYTPREVVDYMVDSSLLEFLKSKTGADEGKLKALISWSQTDDEDHPLTSSEKVKVVTSLASLTILDPACGSGAFPIGILQKVVYILQQADPRAEIWLENQLKNVTSPELRRDIKEKYENENYDWLRKYGVIRETIFGIDIQTIATEISKLRCFLTLVIEEEVDDAKNNRGIHPLPNLDFKFVTANSLVPLPESASKSKSRGLNLFEDVSHIEQLKYIRNQYFSANADERARLQVEFKNLQMDMLRSRIATSGATSDLYNILSDWDPFSHNKTNWFDSEWMFGVDDFDIVIGNPPYYIENDDKSRFDGLRQLECYQGKMNVWYLFGGFGLDSLKPNGVLCFIATNNWTTNAGASKWRNKVISETEIVSLLDFGSYMVFESAAQQTMVMVMTKTEPDNYSFDYRRIFDQKPTKRHFLDLLAGDKAPGCDFFRPTVRKALFLNSLLTFSDEKSQKILDKIDSVGTFRLNGKEVAQGVVFPQDYLNKKSAAKLGGAYKVGDGVFVLSQAEVDSLDLSGAEKELLKPYYTTKQIGRYVSASENDEWVIYTDSHYKNATSFDDYPRLKVHLDKFRSIITSANYPYGLHRARDERFFLGDVIVSLRKSPQRPSFTYVNFPCYVSATFNIIKTNRVSIQYLTGLLNSRLVAFWLQRKGKMQGNNFQIDKEPLLGIPIVIPDMNLRDQIIGRVQAIYKEPGSQQSQETEIDKIVYELYGLKPEEIAIIEAS